FVHQCVRAGDVVLGVVKMAKPALGGAATDGLFGFAFALERSVDNGLDAGDQAAGIIGMRGQISGQAVECVFFTAKSNQRQADMSRAEVGIEVGVDRLEYV